MTDWVNWHYRIRLEIVVKHTNFRNSVIQLTHVRSFKFSIENSSTLEKCSGPKVCCERGFKFLLQTLVKLQMPLSTIAQLFVDKTNRNGLCGCWFRYKNRVRSPPLRETTVLFAESSGRFLYLHPSQFKAAVVYGTVLYLQ
jgi:hypothetical protein